MSGLALIAFVLYFGKALSVPRNCTREDLCLPVSADFCDNSKCLLVNRSQIDEFASIGLKSYKWNIDLLAFSSSCSFKYNYETKAGYDGKITTYQVITFTSGPSCNESSYLEYETKELNDTTCLCTRNEWDLFGDKYDACYLYYEPGVALVIRSCLIDPSYQYGQACAAVYAEVNPDMYADLSYLDNFLEGLGIKLPKIKSDCM